MPLGFALYAFSFVNTRRDLYGLAGVRYFLISASTKSITARI